MKLNRSIDNKIITHSLLWKLSERFVSQGISIIIQVVLARILFPGDFGALVLIVSFINFANIFVQSGLSTAIVQKKDLSLLDISTAYTSSLIIAGLLYFFLFIMAPYIANYYNNIELNSALRVLSLVLFLNAINAVQSAILMRRMDFKVIFFRSLFSVLISGSIAIIMASYGYGLWSLVFYNLINMTIVILVMNFGTDIRIIFGISKASLIKIYNFSGNIMLSNVISGAYDLIRTITIGKRYNALELAYYDKANVYSFYLVSIINSSLASVLLPTFSKIQDYRVGLINLVRKTIELTSFIIIPILIGIISVADLLVRIIFTDKWMACVPYLIVYCFLRIPGCIVNVDKQLYYALGRSDLVLYYESFLIVANLISIFFCLKHGVLTILLGACFVEYLGFIIICIVTQMLFGYSIRSRVKDIYKTLLATLTMYLFIELLKYTIGYTIFSLPIIIICGVILYLLVSFILGNASLLFILHKFVKKR